MSRYRWESASGGGERGPSSSSWSPEPGGGLARPEAGPPPWHGGTVRAHVLVPETRAGQAASGQKPSCPYPLSPVPLPLLQRTLRRALPTGGQIWAGDAGHSPGGAPRVYTGGPGSRPRPRTFSEPEGQAHRRSWTQGLSLQSALLGLVPLIPGLRAKRSGLGLSAHNTTTGTRRSGTICRPWSPPNPPPLLRRETLWLFSGPTMAEDRGSVSPPLLQLGGQVLAAPALRGGHTPPSDPFPAAGMWAQWEPSGPRGRGNT